MNKWKRFFKDIWYGLNPWKYELLVERFMKDMLKQFFIFLAFAFIIGLTLSLPALIAFPASLEGQLDGFDTLAIDINSSMSKPVALPERKPLVTIDTESNESSAFISITGDAIYIGSNQFPLENYKNLLLKKATVSRVIAIMLFLMFPSLILLLFGYFAAKYLLIIAGAVILGLLIARALRFSIAFRKVVGTGMAASTPMILIDMIRIPLDLHLYALSYIIFGVCFLMGMLKVGSFAPKNPRNKKGHDGPEYIEVKNKVF